VTTENLPGTEAHQAVLRVFVAAYANDPRIALVGLFGSLARGDWVNESDLDLDVVIHEGVSLDPVAEVWRLGPPCQAVGQTLALVIPDGDDAANAVFSTLLGLSVRFHLLEATHPNIVHSLLRLSGPLPLEAVVAAGMANRARRRPPPPLGRLVDEYLRFAAEAAIALGRERLWLCAELLARMRALLITLYARTHGGERPLHTFDSDAPPALQSCLGAALPSLDSASMRAALLQLLNLAEHDLPAFTAGQLVLSPAQQAVLAVVRAMLA